MLGGCIRTTLHARMYVYLALYKAHSVQYYMQVLLAVNA